MHVKRLSPIIRGAVICQKSKKCMPYCVQLAWVNLLCFDEAHHATGNHPYALLMKVICLTNVTARMLPPAQGMPPLHESQGPLAAGVLLPPAAQGPTTHLWYDSLACQRRCLAIIGQSGDHNLRTGGHTQCQGMSTLLLLAMSIRDVGPETCNLAVSARKGLRGAAIHRS